MYCPQKNCKCFLFANENSPRSTPFFLDRLKRLLVVQIPENTVYQANAEHIRLRWGWVFLERTRIFSGIQFTTYFIELFVVETTIRR